MNSDCNLTAGLEAVLQVAVRARVMLHINIDVSSGLVNGAVDTVKPTTSLFSLIVGQSLTTSRG